MTDYQSKLALKAELYLQRKASERKLRDAAVDAIRMIAAGCSDPVGRAQAVLDLEVKFERTRRSPPESASYDSTTRYAGSTSGTDVRE